MSMLASNAQSRRYLVIYIILFFCLVLYFINDYGVGHLPSRLGYQLILFQ